MAKQQEGEHEGGTNEGGWHARHEGVAPEGNDDEGVADPLPTEGKHVLKEEGLYEHDDDADMEAR